MYSNNHIFTDSSKFKKVSVLTHDTAWAHYEDAYVYVATNYVLIYAVTAKTQVLLPRESIKVITTEEKIF